MIQLLADASSDSHIGIVLMLVLILCYFLPSIVAKLRNVSSFGSVFVVNLFLGWTFIGWVVALAIACRSPWVNRSYIAEPPRGMEAVACPRCNEVQNIPLGQTTFECWRCKYVARRNDAQEGQDNTLRQIWHDHLSGEGLSHTRDDLRRWWNDRQPGDHQRDR